ncbi:MAG: hypothetical protein GY856_44275, partial [bacterium]|nr:hypothetical protein [bacterium]
MNGERFNPFPGLRSFEEHEDHLFFGRERDLDELLRRLRSTRFLAVLGTSGSGKSSLVKSGLIPALYSGFMSRAGSSWRIAVMRPGEDPIGQLAAALNAPGMLGSQADDAELAGMNRALLESTLRRGDLGFAECVREARLPAHDRLLVVVDQFEELFRFKRSRITGSGDEANAFVQLLLSAAQHDAPIYVVVTMRSDFIGHTTELAGLTDAINRGQYLVPLMDRAQRRAAITGPVAVGGGEISPRLVLRLLNDVGDDPDQLPILQHALMRTWDRWEKDHADGEPLDLRHFEAVGTLKEALDRHAEEAFAELDSERRREVCERLFKCLTEKDPDSHLGVRRPSRLDEICAVSGAHADEVRAVVEVFRRPGRSFLMPPAGSELAAGSVVDISHESLMRVWKRLIRWVDEETEAASFYNRLTEAAGHHDEGTAALWRNPELELGRRWRDKHRPTAAWAERYEPNFERAIAFLEASQQDWERELAARERARRAKLRRARILAVILGSAALLTLAFGLWALHLKGMAEAERQRAEEQRREAVAQREEAERQRREALRQHQRAETERQAADQARGVAEVERQVAEEQKVIAVDKQREADEQRQVAVVARGQAEEARTVADEQREVAEAERQVAEEQRELAEQAEQEARRLRRIAEARALAVETLSFEDEAQHQLAALLALQAYRLNRSSGGEPEDPEVYHALRVASGRLGSDRTEVLLGHQDAVRALALAPDGHTVASGSEDGELRLSDLERPQEGTASVGSFAGGLRALAFAPDGRELAAGSADGSLRLFERARIDQPPRLLVPAGAVVSALSYRPGTPMLAVARADGRVRLWNIDAPDAGPTELDGAGPAPIRALAWSPDGGSLAAGGDGGGVLVWNVSRPAAPPRAIGGGAEVHSLAVSRDGRLLAAGSAGGPIRLFDLDDPGAEPAELRGHTATVAALEFHPRRPLLVSASFDSTLRLWDVERPDALPLVLEGHDFWVYSARFSPDGDFLVSGSGDRT